MRVSVVICSRNRAESLRRTLTSISEASHPASDWELLVVDNGGTDHTADVVADFETRLPIRHVYEPVAGLSVARNRGVAEARGDYFVWTDDDVLVDRDWLSGYVDAFAARPEVALFAGQVRPKLEPPVTPWFAAGERHLSDLMAVRRFTEVAPLTSQTLPFGANFAVRGQEQRSHLYDINLGVAPGRRRGGEETAVAKSILASGESGITVPASIVDHLIPAGRQSLAYVYEYYVAFGEDWPRAKPEAKGLMIAGVSPWLLRRSLACGGAYLFKRLTGGDWLPDYIEYAQWVGTSQCWRSFPREAPLR